MISKAKIKEIKALHLSKFRQIYNKFIAEGDKTCMEFVKNKKYTIHEIYITEQSLQIYRTLLADVWHLVHVIRSQEMEQITALKNASDIFMIAEVKEDVLLETGHDGFSAIYLDGVQDPGNVGTIIRLADWFGVFAVIRSPDAADFFNPKVVQASMGSMVNVHMMTSSLLALRDTHLPIYGAFLDGAHISKTKIPQNAILVLGSEGKGISPENIPLIGHPIFIPGSQERVAESLNVAISAGIICHHWRSNV